MANNSNNIKKCFSLLADKEVKKEQIEMCLPLLRVNYTDHDIHQRIMNLYFTKYPDHKRNKFESHLYTLGILPIEELLADLNQAGGRRRRRTYQKRRKTYKRKSRKN